MLQQYKQLRMPDLGLSEREIADVCAYLESAVLERYDDAAGASGG